MSWVDGVERRTNVEEDSHTMLFVHDVLFDIVNSVGDCAFRASSGQEAMLFMVKRVVDEGCIHLPPHQALQAFKEVVGQRYGSERFWDIIVLLSWFGNENDFGPLPLLWCVG